MERAAVLIGVRDAHTLPRLQAVWDGVDKMAQWAVSQGIKKDRVIRFTDKKKPVQAHEITKAVTELVDLAAIEQLLVYFAGHGVNIGYQEYWLLSDAINNANEAVNVAGTETRARYCGIPHVVFVSDACRTAAEGIQAQGVTGSIIFNNPGAQGVEQDVDLFFATALGQPSLEVKLVAESAGRFRAIYTDTMLDALQGQHPTLLENDATSGLEVVRPRPLRDHLRTEVPRRLFAIDPSGKYSNQVPWGRITSGNSAWVSRMGVVRGGATAPPPPPVVPSRPLDAHSLSQAALQIALDAPGGDVKRFLSDQARPRYYADASGKIDVEELYAHAIEVTKVAESFEKSISLNESTFGPVHFETRCGFKLYQRAVKDVYCVTAKPEILAGDVIRLKLPARPYANVLLEFRNGTGVVLPAIQDFIAGLTFDEEELVNVSYEPSQFSWRWDDFHAREDELRRLRAVVASSTRMGTFQLEDDEDARRIARQMQLAKGVDPSLALYAAYAYRDQQRRQRLKEMAHYLRNDLGMLFFDIAMMDGRLNGKVAGSDEDVLPFLPLLAQGWALLDAYEVRIPPTLREIRRHLVPNSLWTLYDDMGVRMLRTAMKNQEVK